jgi:hypothetical protein
MEGLQRIFEAAKEVTMPGQEVRGAVDARMEERRMLVGEVIDDPVDLRWWSA